MPMLCTICRRDDRQEIDKALLVAQPVRKLALRFALSIDALYRHKNSHLLAKLAKAHEAKEVASADTLLEKLAKIESEALRLAKVAEEKGDYRTAAAVGIRELVRVIELTARLRGELQGGQVNVNVAVLDPTEAGKSALRKMASFYLMAPALFLEDIRRAAAEEESRDGRMTYEQARAVLEARERSEPPSESVLTTARKVVS